MQKRRIEAVLFDLGETLLRFGRMDRSRLVAEAALRSYAYLKDHDQPVGSAGAYRFFHVWGMRWHVFQAWVTGNDFNSLEVLQKFGRKHGFNLTADQWDELNWQWYEVLSKIGQVLPGTVEALKALREMGLKLGVLSNTFVHRNSLERHMQQEGLLEFFDKRMYSYEFPWRKPDVRIFKAAAQKMNIDPEHIIYVGDHLVNDVQGSSAAGMLPVLLKAYTNEKKAIPEGVHRIELIAELPELIAAACEIKTTRNEPKAEPTVCMKR